ncbi:MAG: TIR domain-containing protein [Aliarcobacter sp.]
MFLLKNQLTILKDVGIDIWFDKNIELGEKWHQNTNELKQSDLIIMLISTNFLNSKYIQNMNIKKE